MNEFHLFWWFAEIPSRQWELSFSININNVFITLDFVFYGNELTILPAPRSTKVSTLFQPRITINIISSQDQHCLKKELMMYVDGDDDD